MGRGDSRDFGIGSGHDCWSNAWVLEVPCSACSRDATLDESLRRRQKRRHEICRSVQYGLPRVNGKTSEVIMIT